MFAGELATLIASICCFSFSMSSLACADLALRSSAVIVLDILRRLELNGFDSDLNRRRSVETFVANDFNRWFIFG